MGNSKVLTFNADFCFDSEKNRINIFELNSDHLSRYDMTDPAGISVRKNRIEGLLSRAKRRSAALHILYNPIFKYNQSKALRWGITDQSQLNQSNFYEATEAGIEALRTKLDKDECEHWVLLLSVSVIYDLASQLYTNKEILDAQPYLKKLFNDFPGIVFIGNDDKLNQITVDKFITATQILDKFQPKSSLIINGDSVNDAYEKIVSSLGTDVVFKALSEYSGIGILRARTGNEIRQQLGLLSSAHLRKEKLKIHLSKPSSDAESFWINAGQNNPLIHCQRFENHSIDQDGRRTTYRAVFTVYMYEGCDPEIVVECIYPKKSNVNDFISSEKNPITREEIELISKNENILVLLKNFATEFIKNYKIFNVTQLIERLMKGSDAEVVKAFITHGDLNYPNNYKISNEDVFRIRSIVERLIASSIEGFNNIYGYIRKYLSAFEWSLFSPMSMKLRNSHSWISQDSLNFAIKKTILMMNTGSRFYFVTEITFSEKMIDLIKFFTSAHYLFNYFREIGLNTQALKTDRNFYEAFSLLNLSTSRLKKINTFIEKTVLCLTYYELRISCPEELSQFRSALIFPADSSEKLFTFFNELSLDSKVNLTDSETRLLLLRFLELFDVEYPDSNILLNKPMSHYFNIILNIGIQCGCVDLSKKVSEGRIVEWIKSDIAEMTVPRLSTTPGGLFF